MNRDYVYMTVRNFLKQRIYAVRFIQDARVAQTILEKALAMKDLLELNRHLNFIPLCSFINQNMKDSLLSIFPHPTKGQSKVREKMEQLLQQIDEQLNAKKSFFLCPNDYWKTFSNDLNKAGVNFIWIDYDNGDYLACIYYQI